MFSMETSIAVLSPQDIPSGKHTSVRPSISNYSSTGTYLDRLGPLVQKNAPDTTAAWCTHTAATCPLVIQIHWKLIKKCSVSGNPSQTALINQWVFTDSNAISSPTTPRSIQALKFFSTLSEPSLRALMDFMHIQLICILTLVLLEIPSPPPPVLKWSSHHLHIALSSLEHKWLSPINLCKHSRRKANQQS